MCTEGTATDLIFWQDTRGYHPQNDLFQGQRKRHAGKEKQLELSSILGGLGSKALKF